ncbi:hypothetical protein HDV05_008483 [Chytridiales sp. JEL 0842]|nr:hypothetical protein HDV05_008483 [Chytridiales sp. JEL 0842]
MTWWKPDAQFGVLVAVGTALGTYLVLKNLPASSKGRILPSSSSSSSATHTGKNETTSSKRHVVKSIEDLVGNTPLIRINSLSDETGCEILGKAEFMNIGGSSKDRLALAIVESAERSGLLRPHSGDTIFEGTVGSTGISLATIANAKGYKCHIVMPDDVAQDKYKLLLQLGATVERVRPVPISHPEHFVHIARKRAEEMNSEVTGHRGLYVNQFETLDNFEAHYRTTGPEILTQTNGNIDAFVMGAGTGGTLAGVATYLKSKVGPKVQIILADPEGSGLFNKVKYNVMYAPTEAEGSRRRHQVDTIVEGIGLNRITANFSKAQQGMIDDAIKVMDEEAVEMSRSLLRNEGSSSAVNCVAAYKVAKKLGPAPYEVLE